YRTNEGKPWVLPVVRKVEKAMAEDETLNHEYLSQLGMEEFSKLATRMLLGEDSVALKENRAFGVQTLSGTGALRLGADTLAKHVNYTTFYMSAPTWRKYDFLDRAKEFLEHSKSIILKKYPTSTVLKKARKVIALPGIVESLDGPLNPPKNVTCPRLFFENAPEDSVFILHACAHNPTGVDPTEEQWKEIAKVMKEKKLFPFFDCAYQGFATGDLERDRKAVQYFVSEGFELFCAQSFAKNFGLYNERAGNLTVVLNDSSAITNLRAQITLLVRGNYSNPPAHGVRIVARVLGNPELFEEWKEHIKTMSGRIMEMRKALYDKLKELNTPGTWDHIINQIGMFSYTGLTQPQVQHLVQQYHIYLPKDGRISICGLNTGNVEYVAKAINDAITKIN
ncbi:aspartate aminotransferase, cytoplasmic-like, partial [Centruroides sculpturatus]|uniref:aspartate aminotransferase, cytoplasmic-like n=1 Tax=Centruroides sculpturatus TaxID=218467 RepID=UPI000C6CCDD3